MRAFHPLVVWFVFAAVGCGRQPAPNPAPNVDPAVKDGPAKNWQEARSAQGRFAISLPAGAVSKQSRQTSPGAVGPVTNDIISADLPDRSAVVVNVTRATPDPAAPRPDNEAVVAKVVDALVQKFNGQNVKRTPIKLGKIPGTAAEFSAPGNSKGMIRIFYGDGKLIQLTFMGPAGSPYLQNVDRIFDSFKDESGKNPPN